MLGTFVVVFFYLTQTEEKTLFSKEKAITCFIIASSYIGARAMCAGNHITASGAVLNPAISIGTSFTQLFVWGGTGIKWIWLYGGIPFAGAVIAVLFYEFIFKKTQEVLNDDFEEEDVDTLLDK
jgi:glycerol uptake facilitator-like aquaporin